MKYLPLLSGAASAVGGAGTALRATKLGQTLGRTAASRKKLAEGVKAAKETPMGQAWGHLQGASAKNQAANQQLEAESRQLVRGGANVGSTTMGS